MKMTLIVVATGFAGVLAGAAAASYRGAEQLPIPSERAAPAPARQAVSSPRIILPSPFRQTTPQRTAEAPDAKWPPAGGAVEHNEAMVALLTLASTPKASAREDGPAHGAIDNVQANAAQANEAQANIAQQRASNPDERAPAPRRARRAPQAGNDTIVVRDIHGRHIRIKRAHIPQMGGYRARIYASSPRRRYGPPIGYH